MQPACVAIIIQICSCAMPTEHPGTRVFVIADCSRKAVVGDHDFFFVLFREVRILRKFPGYPRVVNFLKIGKMITSSLSSTSGYWDTNNVYNAVCTSWLINAASSLRLSRGN